MKNQFYKPPRILRILLYMFAVDSEYSQIFGDFEEEYDLITRQNGKMYALRWYLLQIIISIPPFLKTTFTGNLMMLKNYLKIGTRNLMKHKGYSFINIFGLALGMACALLIYVWAQHEMSYDMFHDNSGSIYQVQQTIYLDNGSQNTESTCGPLGPDLNRTFPDVKGYARIGKPGELLIKAEEINFIEEDVYCVDPSFFSMFTFPAVFGDPGTVLNDPRSAVITEEYAEKYFGQKNPTGNVLTINGEHDFTIAAVIRDVPENTIFRFSVVLPLTYYNDLGIDYDAYTNTLFNTFIILDESTEYEPVSNTVFKTFTKPEEESGLKRRYFFIPMSDVHLDSRQGFSRIAVNVLSVISLLILLIACINFINLSTARSMSRAKEVGMRKAFGANRLQLVQQFLSESFIMACLALLLAVILAYLLVPVIESISKVRISLNFFDPATAGGAAAILLFTIITAGGYPSFVLSRFNPVNALKPGVHTGRRKSRLRKTLVVLQFTCSIFFIVSTTVLYLQMRHMGTTNLGLETEDVLYLRSEHWDVTAGLKQALLSLPDVTAVSGTSDLPFMIDSFDTNWGRKNNDGSTLCGQLYTDESFIDIFEIPMKEGRFYSAGMATDRRDAIVINSAAVQHLGLDEPLGKPFYHGDQEYTIIGIIDDFYFFPLSLGMGPLMVKHYSQEDGRHLFIKVKSGSFAETKESIAVVLGEFYPGYPFDPIYLDDYKIDEGEFLIRITNILIYFTLLGVFIACLGLLGLASYSSEQRTKEIGIRKVLGSPSAGIIGLLTRESVILVVLANIIACPAAYLAMSAVLDYFAYRIDLSIWIFALTGCIVLMIALLTVSVQAVRASAKNPVDSLRYE